MSMSFYRSDLMDHYKIIIPRQNAWNIMNSLGQLNMIHIVKNDRPNQHNPYVIQMKRCEQSLLKIYNLQKVLQKKKLYQPNLEYKHPQMNNIFKIIAQKHVTLQKNKSTSILGQIQEQVDQLWKKYKSLNSRVQSLEERLEYLRQNMAIIKAQQKMFGIKRSSSKDLTSKQQRFFELFENEDLLRVKCGVLDKSEQQRFAKTVFRITRGLSFLKFASFQQIYDKVTTKQARKSVYFIIFPGKKNSYFEKKLVKLMKNYHETYQEMYELPNEHVENLKVLKKLSTQYHQSETMLKLTQQELLHFLNQNLLGFDSFLNQDNKHLHQFNVKYSQISLLKVYLLKQLQIHSNLKQMDIYNNFLQGQIYVKSSLVDQLKSKIVHLQKKTRNPTIKLVPISNANAKSHRTPTSFRLNSYNRSAQEIVETYGVCKYREANPALFTTVTFPFLFGVMFGDIGHGSVLFLVGILLIIFKQQIKKTSFKSVTKHRYLLTLMGFFSTYCGFVYNDFLSINLNLFSSCYNPQSVQPGSIIPRSQSCIYPFGLDPVWARAENSLNYVNSLKMKLSVILGVIHMTFGIILKATNSVYFRRKIQFWFETIPQLIFMVMVFGYMDFLIIFKWLKNWGYGNPHAPSIITTMINLPLNVGKTDKQCCHGGQPMWGTAYDTSQDRFQIVILIFAVVCIPLMLLVKPLYMIGQTKRRHEKGQQLRQNSEGNEQDNMQVQNDFSYQIFDDQYDEQFENMDQKEKKELDFDQIQEEHDASEIFVHQMIETIEFVLGCISNTASYLRLWALSLAHSQLSEVFLQKTLVGPLQSGYKGIIGLLILFPFFAAATFGVLMCMDVMECFLHTLRLHWVQFQSKFYKGDGYLFEPYNFLTKVNAHAALKAQKAQTTDGQRKQ